ncbi:MAG: bifunctional riboflavin kinase/FAD synthetase [Pirellula sp.]
MNLLISKSDAVPIEAQGGAITIGNFDGVHRGHRTVIEQVRRLADKVHGPAVVLTFDPPPVRLLRPEAAPEALTVIERRAELLRQLGIDFVIVYETSHELLRLEPEQFFDQIVIGKLKTKAIAEGENFRFGYQRRGDVVVLQDLCRQHAIQFSMLEPTKENEEWISSSRIRALLETGDVATANDLLLEPYRISGVVVHGAARGKTLGFPTANLEEIPVLCPPPGVYAGRVAAVNSATKTPFPNVSEVIDAVTGLPAAIHIGPNPTFGEKSLKVEAHIVGFDGDLYGQLLALELLEKVRDVRKFDSKEQLLAQLSRDIERTCGIASIRAHADQLP